MIQTGKVGSYAVWEVSFHVVAEDLSSEKRKIVVYAESVEKAFRNAEDKIKLVRGLYADKVAHSNDRILIMLIAVAWVASIEQHILGFFEYERSKFLLCTLEVAKDMGAPSSVLLELTAAYAREAFKN